MCSLGVSLATSTACTMSEVGDLCTASAMWLGRHLGGASFYTELDSAYISSREWLLLNSGEYDLHGCARETSRDFCATRILRA